MSCSRSRISRSATWSISRSCATCSSRAGSWTEPAQRLRGEPLRADDLLLFAPRPAHAHAQDRVALADVERSGERASGPERLVAHAAHAQRRMFFFSLFFLFPLFPLFFLVALEALVPVLLAAIEDHVDAHRLRERRQLIEALRDAGARAELRVDKCLALHRADIALRQHLARVQRGENQSSCKQTGHRGTVGVAAVQTCTGPRLRLITFNRYVPPALTGWLITAIPEALVDVASVSPAGSMRTICTGSCGVDSAAMEIAVAFGGIASDVVDCC